MRGLPWFKLPTLTDDAGMYMLQDKAYRAFIELHSIANKWATGPRLSYKLARKESRMSKFAEAIRLLEQAGAVRLSGDVLEILWFAEYITGAEKIEAQRARWRKEKKTAGQDSLLDGFEAQEHTGGTTEGQQRVNGGSMEVRAAEAKALLSEESGDVFRSGISKESDPLDLRVESTTPIGVGDILGAARKEAEAQGLTLEKSFYSRLGKVAKELLEAGADVEMLRGAAKVVVSKNKTPTALPGVLRDMQASRGGGAVGRSDGTTWRR